MLIAVFLIIIGGFILRIYPHLKYEYVGSDAYYHLIAAQKIRDNSFRLPRVIDRFTVEGEYRYPPLFHLILAVLPRCIHKYFPAAVETLHSLFVFVAVLGIYGELPALIAVTVFTLIPKNIGYTTTLNPRPLGALSVSLIMVALFMYYRTGIYNYILIGGIFTGLLLLTHKMSTQFIAVAVIFLAAYLSIENPVKSLLAVIVLIFGFVMAVIISKGHYLKVLNEHLRFIFFHLNYGDFSGKKKIKNPVKLVKYNPWILLLIFLVFSKNLINNENTKFFLLWSSVSIALAVFWIWGDSVRYLEYASFPSSILIGLWISSNIKVNTIIAIVIAVVSLSIIMIYWKKAYFVLDNDLITCLDFLKNIPIANGKKLLCLPGNMNYIAAYLTPLKIIGGSADYAGLKYNLEVFRPETTAQKIEGFIAENKPDYIVYDKNIYGNLDYKHIHEAGIYSVCES